MILKDSQFTTIPLAELEIGDQVVFGSDRTTYVIVADIDAIVAIDELGVHFAGGSYLSPEDVAEVWILVNEMN